MPTSNWCRMRDLYRRLGVPQWATNEEIEAALRGRSHEFAADVRAALLNADRRKIYDANHVVLNQIARLRVRLDLNNGTNWNGDAAGDYSISKPVATTPHQRLSTIAHGAIKSVAGFLGTIFSEAWCVIPIFFMIVCGIGTISGDGKPSNAASGKSTSRPAPSPAYRPSPTPPPFLAPEQPLPASGPIYRRFAANKALAPLKLESSGYDHHLVKLVATATGQPAMIVFVRAGASLKVEVPLGSYELRYASGRAWYGETLLFGPSTSYSRSDETFTFDRVGNKIRGFTITLYAVENGNLHTQAIDADAF